MIKDTFESGHIYHVFNRGNNKENIFISDRHYQYFLSLIKKHIVPICDIYSYCLLPNHFHLLLKIKDKIEILIKFHNKLHLPFSNLFNSYTKSFNNEIGRSGSLFQEHLHRKRILQEDYFLKLIIYIHLNPYKHLKLDYKNYKYSSYTAYNSNTITNIKKDFVMSYFGDINSFKSYHSERLNMIDELLNHNELIYI